MGAEGAGKTTLAQQLEILLRRADLSVERRHVYGFFHNVCVTPLTLLRNRYFGAKVLIFDRGIYDNLANYAVTRKTGDSTLRSLMAITLPWYPNFDHAWYLEATSQDTFERRSRTDADRLERFLSAYRLIARASGFKTFVTKPPLLREVVETFLSRYSL